MHKINYRVIIMSKSSLTIGILIICVLSNYGLFAQNNLSLTATANANSSQKNHAAEFSIDGDPNTIWKSENSKDYKWLKVVLPGATEITKVHLSMQTAIGSPIENYAIQTFLNGKWISVGHSKDKQQKEVVVSFKTALLTDRLRISIKDSGVVWIKEFKIFGEQYEDGTIAKPKKVLINQSGYNLNKPKRFTVPEIADNTIFAVKKVSTQEKVYQGAIQNQIGDFTQFNPISDEEYIITIDTLSSYPFRIGPFWLERVTYQNMVDFMAGARHYTGSTDKIARLSWEWRDGCTFNWALQTLTAQFLSNPEAYMRMEKKITYVPNNTFGDEYKGFWGKLEPYGKEAPDIVKLIHWDADVKISQQLEHEVQKAELAHFLYAFPYLKEWLPQQNFDIVYQYLKEKWTKSTVAERSTTMYSLSPEHNLLALKTQLGTTKGELPPGHSVIPNLMMYEVTKRKGEADADKYFDAAYEQMEWMIANLDWNDPDTTKGQRMSEHMTMRAFAFFYSQYPDRAPKGLYRKVEEWAMIMIARSNNMWDFRKFTDDGDWVPHGWNEPGNILGFPACALAAKSILQNKELQKKLERLVWSHFDDAFGRNPTGRHFSYDGPTEIEGVDLGWYSFHRGGIGMLEDVPFVFDGSPKTNHYPNHPEIGNLGWTEGWVHFNTAFNVSMAYLAYSDTEIEMTKIDKKTMKIRLKAPLNFDEKIIDKVDVKVISSSGDVLNVVLTEEDQYSRHLSGNFKVRKKKKKEGDSILQVKRNDDITTSYGLGYFQRSTSIKIK